MKSFWSNQLYCKICGHTNRYFYMGRYVYKGEVRYYKSKVCVECERERAKEKRLNHQRGPVFKAWQVRYVAEHKEHIRQINLIHARNYYKRQKEIKALEQKKRDMIGKVLL